MHTWTQKFTVTYICTNADNVCYIAIIYSWIARLHCIEITYSTEIVGQDTFLTSMSTRTYLAIGNYIDMQPFVSLLKHVSSLQGNSSKINLLWDMTAVKVKVNRNILQSQQSSASLSI